MKNLLLFIIGIAIFAGAGYWYYQNQTKSPELIGGQKDAHGCLIPAGYSWCEAKQKCLRPWEETCVAASTTQSTSIDTSNWKTYKNDQYGFEFKYPGNVSDISIDTNVAQKNPDGSYFVGEYGNFTDANDIVISGNKEGFSVSILKYPNILTIEEGHGGESSLNMTEYNKVLTDLPVGTYNNASLPPSIKISDDLAVYLSPGYDNYQILSIGAQKIKVREHEIIGAREGPDQSIYEFFIGDKYIVVRNYKPYIYNDAEIRAIISTFR